MCHSLTALPDGRLLVIGGRNKEGICRDTWLLDTVRPQQALDSKSLAFNLRVIQQVILGSTPNPKP